MPIHKTDSGEYQWGSGGKVYPTREQAKEQAAAAHANGFVGDAELLGAGIAFFTSNGEALFLKRGDGGDHPGEWCFPGGSPEAGETPEQTAMRETMEEAGGLPYGERELIARHGANDEGGKDFLTYLQHVTRPFAPKLSDEHTDAVWASIHKPPEPLHPGVKSALADIVGKFTPAKTAMDGLAFDRGSVRTIDQDGRMHVEICNISKATVNPYLGSEVADGDALGLDPNKIYMLLRDPEELAKAAPTFNNIPLLSEHVPVSVDDHQPKLVVGATGSDAVFEAPYLRNSLVVWTADAIRGIESGNQQELSCAYRYSADMTPGTYEGMRYDGVMRNIQGNHVALVELGRAGPDVVVGDSIINLNGEIPMTKKSLSVRATVAKGALLAVLRPKLAADKMPSLNNILAGVTHKNWLEKKPGIIAKLKPSLANDADLEGVVKLLDMLDGDKPDENTGMDDEMVDALDADPIEECLAMCRGKLSDEDLKALEEKMRAMAPAKQGAQDEPPAFAAKPKEPDTVAKPKVEDTKVEDDKVSKPAMDAAIAAAVKAAEQATVARMRGITEAEETVRPYVGKLAVTCDSAEAVYRTALTTMGIDLKDVHPSAFKAILSAQPKPGESRTKIAADSAAPSNIADLCPNLYRLQRA